MKKLGREDNIGSVKLTVNQLIDEVEALKKHLADHVDHEARHITEPADDKATITTVGIVENGKAIGWEFDCRGKIPGMTFNSDGTQLIAGYTIEELKKIADDTHRTVTLRIPKGMTVGWAMVMAYSKSYKHDDWVSFFEQSDTDLQKALDEVEK